MDPELEQLRARLSALGDTEALLTALFAHAPVAFQVYRADGRSLLVNEAFRRMFGVEPPPEYNVFRDEVAERSGLAGMIRRAFRGEVIQTPPVWYDPREMVHVAVREGRRVAMEVTFFPLQSVDGVVTHVVVTAKDRTAELLAQEQLEAEQRKLLAVEQAARREAEARRETLERERRAQEEARALVDALLDAAPVGVAFFDRQMRFVRLNQTLARMNGFALEAHLGKTPEELAPNEVSAAVVRSLRRVSDSGEGSAQEFTSQPSRTTGEARTWWANHFPVRVQGEVVGVGVTCEDITARKRSDQRQSMLAEAGRILSSSLDLGPMLADIARLLVGQMATVAAIDLLDAQGHLGGPRVVVHREQVWVEEAEARYRQSVDQGDAQHPARLAAASGLTCLVPFDDTPGREVGPLAPLGLRSALWVPLVSRGRVLGVLFVGSSDRSYDEVDQTAVEELGRRAASVVDNVRLFELAQVERQRAEEASRAKDEFLAVVSHELRTPLQAILGWARLMQTGALSADQQHQALRTIERNARAQTQLIEDLLDVSRIITGKLRLCVGNVDLAHVAEGAIDAIRPAADAKGLGLHLNIEPGLDLLPGDPERLQQVIWNMLSNAVRYTPRGGQIQVTLRRTEGWVEVNVSDNGEGIEPEFLPHVFERFRQADAGTTRRHGGLGLGLSISKHLIELHGGTIEAASEGPGRGATFTVRLPLLPPRPEAEPAREYTRELGSGPPSGAIAYPPALRGLRVLVVDDEDDARELLRSVLHHGQAEVYTAASAEEALDMVERLRPDIIVSDIGMPGQDGYALLRAVRALPPERGGRTPALALTAYARTEDRTRALEVGFQRHLSKPVEPQVLVRALLALAQEGASADPRHPG